MSDLQVRDWQEAIRTAAGRRTKLRLRGGGTKDFYGQALEGEVLDTRAWAGIVEYDPTELVITARAGTPLAELEAAMRERGQMLAFEPPHFGAGATLGGCIAAGLSGPRRAYAGAVRDLVLGVRVIDGKGNDLRFGGQVMKNVAGFDVSRLMVGALGTLGLLLEVSMKALPLPASETTLAFDMPPAEGIAKVNAWGGQPLPLSATAQVGSRLYVRLSGAASAVKSAREKLGGEEVGRVASRGEEVGGAASGGGGAGAAGGPDLWTSIREHTHAHFAGAPALWRLSVKSTAPFVDLGGPQLVEWGGALRWLRADAPVDAAKLRAWAKEQGGHATLFRGGDRAVGVFQPLAPPVLAVHKRLKEAFDPQGILNPGRMYPDF